MVFSSTSSQEIALGMSQVKSIIVYGAENAGKCSFVGNLLYSCGAVDMRTLEQLQQGKLGAEKRGWSAVAEQIRIDREAGKSSGGAFCSPKRKYQILDIQGHSRFPIASQGHPNLAILVIPANAESNEKSSWKTLLQECKEHSTEVLIVVTKVDVGTFSMKIFQHFEGLVTLIAQEVGISVSIVPAHCKGNLVEKCPELSWWEGHTVLEMLDTFS